MRKQNERMKLVTFAVIFSFMVAGCAANRFQRITDSMNAHIGQLTIEDAIAMWGPPDYERKAGNLSLLAWVKTHYRSFQVPPPSGPPPATGGPVGGFVGGFAHGLQLGLSMRSTTTITKEILMLWFSEDGVMYRWEYKEL